MENITARALLPQSPYKKRKLKPYHIKYYWLIVVFLMMIASIKVFINYATIQTSIEQVMKDTISISRHKQYAALQLYAYRLPEAEQFIAHDNGIVINGERIFVKTTWPKSLSGSIQTWSIIPETIVKKEVSPFRSWMQYFSNKMNH
jgi:hypothetical protein